MKHFICLILTIFTAGLFLPVWIILALYWGSSNASQDYTDFPQSKDYKGPIYHQPPPIKPKKPYKPRPDIHTSYKAEVHTDVVNYSPPTTRLTLPRMFYVYQYVNVTTGAIIYVGKGSKGRFANYDGRDQDIQSLWNNGYLAIQILAENFISSKASEKYEKHIIKGYISKGYDLYNKVHNPFR